MILMSKNKCIFSYLHMSEMHCTNKIYQQLESLWHNNQLQLHIKFTQLANLWKSQGHEIKFEVLNLFICLCYGSTLVKESVKFS